MRILRPSLRCQRIMASNLPGAVARPSSVVLPGRLSSPTAISLLSIRCQHLFWQPLNPSTRPQRLLSSRKWMLGILSTCVDCVQPYEVHSRYLRSRRVFQREWLFLTDQDVPARHRDAYRRHVLQWRQNVICTHLARRNAQHTWYLQNQAVKVLA